MFRETNAVAPTDPRLDITRRIKHSITKKHKLGQELFTEYAEVLGMKPDTNFANKLMQTWNEARVVHLTQESTTHALLFV